MHEYKNNITPQSINNFPSNEAKAEKNNVKDAVKDAGVASSVASNVAVTREANEAKNKLEEILQTVMPVQRQTLQLFISRYGKEKCMSGVGELNYLDVEKGILKVLIPADFFDGRVRYDRNIFFFVDEYSYKNEAEILKHALNAENYKKLSPETGDGFGIAQTNFFIFTKKIRGYTKGHKIAMGKVSIYTDEPGAVSRACLLFGALYKRRSEKFFEAVERNNVKLYDILGDIFKLFGEMGTKLIKTAYDILLFKKKTKFFTKSRDDCGDNYKKTEFLDTLLKHNYTVETLNGEKVFNFRTNEYG